MKLGLYYIPDKLYHAAEFTGKKKICTIPSACSSNAGERRRATTDKIEIQK